MDETYTLIHSPVSAITPTSTSIEFHVPGVSDFLSPRHCLVDLTFKVRPEVHPRMGKPTNQPTNRVAYSKLNFFFTQILNEDGTNLEPDSDKGRNIIACIQSPAYSMFKSIEVKLGNEIISDSYQSYHMASYFMVSH